MCMPQHTCAPYGDERASLRTWVNLSTLTWVLGIQLRSTGLCVKILYPLSYLTVPTGCFVAACRVA